MHSMNLIALSKLYNFSHLNLTFSFIVFCSYIFRAFCLYLAWKYFCLLWTAHYMQQTQFIMHKTHKYNHYMHFLTIFQTLKLVTTDSRTDRPTLPGIELVQGEVGRNVMNVSGMVRGLVILAENLLTGGYRRRGD